MCRAAMPIMPEADPRWKVLLRRWLPPLGALALLAYLLSSTDLAEVGRALQRADLPRFAATGVVATVVTWLYDSWCLSWLVRTTLGDRGAASQSSWRAMLPLKAASYLLNMVNYHAASLGMAYLIGRRQKVAFLEAAGALALLSYLDIIAVSVMAMVGVWVAPDFFGPYPALQAWLKTVATVVIAVALAVALALQSSWQLQLLQRLRGLAPLRPLAAMRPQAMLVGLLLRGGLVLMYAATGFGLMRAFGMQPQWGRMLIAVPILTVVGTLPISVSGLGSTQVLMRSFYGPFVVAGQPIQAVVDGFSTLYIVGILLWRALLAAPFFPRIVKELRSPAGSGSGAADGPSAP